MYNKICHLLQPRRPLLFSRTMPRHSPSVGHGSALQKHRQHRNKKGKPPPSPRDRRLPGPQARRRRSTRRSPQGRSTRHRCGRRAPPHRYLRLPQPTSRGQRPLPDLRLKHAVSFCFLASNRRSHDDHNSGSCGREMRCRPQTRPRPCLCVARRWYCPVPTPALFTVNQRRRHRLFCFNLYELRPISICFASAYMKYGRIGC